VNKKALFYPKSTNMSRIILKFDYTGRMCVCFRKNQQEGFNFMHIMFINLEYVVLHSIDSSHFITKILSSITANKK